MVPRPQELEFFAGAPLGGVECEMDDDPGINAVGVGCQSISTTPSYIQTATLAANGGVRLCAAVPSEGALTNPCDLGNAGLNTPTFNVGKQVTVGPFRCQVLASEPHTAERLCKRRG
jgi:hypothetical protein